MKKYLMDEMTWEEFREAVEENPVAVIPIGSIEQHGPHLPLGTDSLIDFYLAKKAVERVSRRRAHGQRILLVPQSCIGLSLEHLDFPGTLSFKNSQSLIDYMNHVCENLVSHGIRKIVIWNGHGGNTPSLMAVVREVRKKTGAFVCLADWFGLTKDLANDIMETRVRVHADEVETSVMLYLYPRLVQMRKAKRELPKRFLSSKSFRSLNESPYASWLTKDVSVSGTIGDPTKASKEKGRKITETAIERFCCLLEEVASWRDSKTSYKS